MGLLDDAIREHLELKRQAGADAMDVARQEREALGPGRSDPDDAYGDPAEEPYPASEPYDPERYSAPEVAAAGGPSLYDDEEDYLEEPVPAAPEPAAPPPEPVYEPPPPPPPVEVAPAPPAPPPAGPATEEYRMAPADHEPDDVLEQTPDFLQETPEHDRLWFEQAPPQEFDFDK